MCQAERRSLQNGTDNHNRRAQENHLPSAEDVADENGDDCTHETADVVTGNGNTLDGGNVGVAWVIYCVDLWELSDPTSESEESSHHTLVVTEEIGRGLVGFLVARAFGLDIPELSRDMGEARM